MNVNNEANEIGLLEYFNTSGWVPVCFTEAFNEHAADVTCRQLGYPFATSFSSVALHYDRPGIGITASFCEEANSTYLFSCVSSVNMTCQTQLYLTCYNSKHIDYIINIYNEWDIFIGSNTVRLIGGPVEYLGRVEVFDRTSNKWGTLCYNDTVLYQYHLSNIVCKSLGFFSAYIYGSASSFPNIALSPNNPIATGPIHCIYPSSNVYQNLYQCSDFESQLGISISRCTSDQEWIVMCTRKFLIIMYYLPANK